MHSRCKTILIGARRSGGKIRLWVIDDGCGIAATDTEWLFEDYTKGPSDAPGGFGLGLASARRAAAAMDGRAGIEPRWTNGCAFWIELPTARPLPDVKFISLREAV
jgi:signal transduction histidine kinase